MSSNEAGRSVETTIGSSGVGPGVVLGAPHAARSTRMPTEIRASAIIRMTWYRALGRETGNSEVVHAAGRECVTATAHADATRTKRIPA
jgi:hypothetical protein